MSQLTAILTDYGLARMVNAHLTGEAINLTHIAVGDGAEPITKDMTELHSEVWRSAVDFFGLSPLGDNTLEAQVSIPAADGGFTVREAGLFDDDEKLFAICGVGEIAKPVPDGGYEVEMLIKMQLAVSNADVVVFHVDASGFHATYSYVDGLVCKLALSAAVATMMAATEKLERYTKDGV